MGFDSRTQFRGKGNVSIGELIDFAAREIKRSGSATPKLDALILMEHALASHPNPDPGADAAAAACKNKSWLSAHPEFIPGETAAESFLRAVETRTTGLPVAYITGTKFFWKHEFLVTRDVLIPKPDTEILVERAEEIIRTRFPTELAASGALSLLDMCTGSGCVAVSLKADFPSLDVTAADISAAALAIAQKNAATVLNASLERAAHESARTKTAPITFIRCDLRNGLPGAKTPGGWHIITANPPYVPTETAARLLADGRGEPMQALDGGEDGLELIKPLVFHSAAVLASGGLLLVETGEYNADKTAEYFQTAGFIDIFIRRDLSGQKRVVEGTRGARARPSGTATGQANNKGGRT